MSHWIRLVEHKFVKRNDRPVDSFAPLRSPEEAIELLAEPGHTRAEFLKGNQLTKLFYDYDVKCKCKADALAAKPRHLQAVRDAMDAVVAVFREVSPDVTYVLAERHGFIPPDKGDDGVEGVDGDMGYKISYRVFFEGISIIYWKTWLVMDAVPELRAALASPCWDRTPYRRSSQLLCAILGRKEKGDDRVLVPVDPITKTDLLKYLASSVDPDWPTMLAGALEEEAEEGAPVGGIGGTGGTGYGAPPPDPDRVEALVELLGASATCYKKWVNVALILRSLREGETERYFDAWLRFSAKGGDKYKGPRDCIKTWNSLRLRQEKWMERNLKIATLYMYAKHDDPAGYAAWRLHGTAELKKETPFECPGLFDAAERVLGGAPEDARIDGGGNVAFTVDGKEYSIKLATLGVTERPSLESRGYLYDQAPGIASAGPIVVPGSHAPSNGYSITRPDANTVCMRSDGPPRVELHVDMVGDSAKRITAFFPDNGKRTPLRHTKELLAMVERTIRDSIRGHLVNVMQVPLTVVNNAFNGCTFINGNVGVTKNDDTESDFVVLRDKLMTHAMANRLRKADGAVYAPVEGCPCAYEEVYNTEGFVNKVLAREPMFHLHPGRLKDLVAYVNTYTELVDMPQFVVDRRYLSFGNGLLDIETMGFTPYADIDSDIGGIVARHHIKGAWTGSTVTPLLDTVFDAQFGRDVSTVLCALLGRLLFPVGHLDDWQVMPFLVGIGGTGKSVILKVAQDMFRHNAVGRVGTTREEVFGMANLVDKEVVIGHEMAQALSKALPQELMQSMVAGDGMEVPRKGMTAINVAAWTAPLAMASNHIPDYVNTGGNVGRRIAVVRFGSVVAKPVYGLHKRIVEAELPNVVCRFLTAYHAARAIPDRVFWDMVPPVMRGWQSDMAAATNKLHDFLAMDDDDRGVVITRVPGAVTWCLDFKERFEARMRCPFKADTAVFQQFGFSVSDTRVMTCLACKQLARAGCCQEWSRDARGVKVVIHDMVMA